MYPVKKRWFLLLVTIICTQFVSAQLPDTSGKSSLTVRYNSIPDFSRYANRYRILSNVNDNYSTIEFSYSIQDRLRQTGYSDFSLFRAMTFLSGTSNELPFKPENEKELFYGIWRNQLVKSRDQVSIKQSMEDGTSTLLSMGYSDLGQDFLPFITRLMEEQQLINYDPGRTKIFGKGSKGIVTSVQILNALGAENTEINYGVCRDVHETARELLKTMCETYYGKLYPGKDINFDDYLFLQSWMTNKSHHVTLSLVDPVNNGRVYELDWGRVIERTGINNYNNGRMYGNTYRMWQFDSRKNRSVPIDFKRTQFGKILDEHILSAGEYMQFNGIYDNEDYSDISFRKDAGKYGELTFSLGTYHPEQRYFLSGWKLGTTGKKIGFLSHSTTFALQGAFQEDTRKKQLLYPQKDWDLTVSLMGIPRIISDFEASIYNKKNFTVEAFLKQQFDMFLIVSSFKFGSASPEDKNEISWSGDGNLSFSNGLRLKHITADQTISNSLIVQARSCLLPNDIRLMTPNPFTLFSHLKIVTPAFDAITSSVFRYRKNSSFSVGTVFEFTNLDAILFSGDVSSKTFISQDLYFVLSAGITEQLKGMHYFWYPAEQGRGDLSIGFNNSQVSASLFKYFSGGPGFSLAFRRIIK